MGPKCCGECTFVSHERVLPEPLAFMCSSRPWKHGERRPPDGMGELD